MRDEPKQVVTVGGGVAEAGPALEPVRVEAAAADLHDRASQALRRKCVNPDLPGHRRRVVKGIVKAIQHDVQASVCGTGIG
jgi:hypothetical protein